MNWKTLIIAILIILAVLGVGYYLGFKIGSGGERIVIRDREVTVEIKVPVIDTLPADIRWYPLRDVVVDSTEILRLIALRDSLAIELQRHNIDYIASADTVLCHLEREKIYCDSIDIEYSELYKTFNRIKIGIQQRKVAVRDSLVFVPTPVNKTFYLGLGLHIGGGWGNGSGFGPQIGIGVQLGWIFM